MIVISNGHDKFHLARAAIEANKRKMLDSYITGGYPSANIKYLIFLFKLNTFITIQRFLKREENIPESLVHSLWLTELINQSAALFSKLSGTSSYVESIKNYGLRLYGYQSAALIKRSSAKIYHFRAGYGHKSAKEAKRMGMVTLCDHSITHPNVLEYLVANNGRLPKIGQEVPISIFWENILEDINQADFVLVNSDFVKDTFIHQGFDSNRIYVIYLGLDDEFFEAVVKSPSKETYDNVLKIAFAGDFSQRKGADLVVQAFQRLNGLDWQLEIVGGISPAIRARYSFFFADPRVKVIGYVSRTKLAEYLSQTDIFVFPSLAEGSARVIFEALACGCYVITVPNSGSIVEDGIHGALVPPGDVDALEKAIRQTFMMDRKEIARTGKNNADLIKTSYRQSHYGDSLFQLYESLLNS